MAYGSRLAIVAAAALLLSGCGGNDGQQRKAFVTFLQTRILDKPGMHVPLPTDEERASFGRYADQYAVITDFNKTMNENMSSKLSQAMNAGSITSLEDLVTKRSQVAAAKAMIDSMSGSIAGTVATADAAHAKLDQPPEVKVVYDKAFNRLVTKPAAVFKDVVPVMDKVLGEAIDLGTYIDAHRGQVRVSGSTIETSDPTVRAAINDKLHALAASQQEVQAAQAKMQAAAFGTGD